MNYDEGMFTVFLGHVMRYSKLTVNRTCSDVDLFNVTAYSFILSPELKVNSKYKFMLITFMFNN